MQVVSKLELKIEEFQKCHTACDYDCPLGVLYDYSCALQSFVLDKMKAAQEAVKSQKSEELSD